MCTKRKSKWFPLISMGLLIVVITNSIEHLSSWHITDLFKGMLMGTGIGIEIIGLILINKERRQTKDNKS